MKIQDNLMMIPVNDSQRVDVCQCKEQVLHVESQFDKIHRFDDFGKLRGFNVRHGLNQDGI